MIETDRLHTLRLTRRVLRAMLFSEGQNAHNALILLGNLEDGRGSWIRTNDLQYPKLPRYQAALYPDHVLGNASIHAKSPAIKAVFGGGKARPDRSRTGAFSLFEAFS